MTDYCLLCGHRMADHGPAGCAANDRRCPCLAVPLPPCRCNGGDLPAFDHHHDCPRSNP